MLHKRTLISLLSKGVVIGLGAAIGVASVAAWTGPSGTAPNSNVSAPINVSGTAQVKSGTLQASRFYDDNAAYYVDSNVTSVMNAIDAAGTITAPRFYTDSATYLPHTNGYNYLRGHTFFNGVLYDENNSSYYLDPSGTSVVNALNANGFFNANSGLEAGSISLIKSLWIGDGSEGWLAIQAGAIASGAGTHFVCWSNGGTFRLTRTTGSCVASDRRLKKNITPLEKGLAEVVKLDPVEYEWKDKARGEGKQIGLIAQEVKEIFPEAVDGTGAEGDWYSVDFNSLIAPMIKAIQELKAENDELKTRIEKLEAAR
ncbi:MAG: tail fiber domain-containing protein [Candidatus Pacebacteria bacterium]|nr:tail fiber domain-containing protein [Candidatus Paceibacterota bacterium]